MRKLIGALVTILLLGASLTTLSSTAEAETTHDRKRRDRVSAVVDGLEAYARANGSYRVAGAGNNGHGWFSHVDGNKYEVSIADALVEAGMLDSPALDDPTLNARHQDGFYTKVCGDRIGVFSYSDEIQTSASDERWWAANSCSTWVIDNQNHTYFHLSKPLGDLALSDDQHRIAAVDRVLDALVAYEDATGTYAVDAGKNGQGRGWFSREDGAPYVLSIATRLADLGYLDPTNVPEDPNVRDSYKRGLLVYQCEDRVGVFSETDGSIAPSTEDAAWWDDNDCNRYPLDNRNHDYFVLSEAAPLALEPAWVSGAEITLVSLSFDDFTIGWGSLHGAGGATDHLVLQVQDSNGIRESWQIFHNQANEYKVDEFQDQPLNPNETYSLALFAVNGSGWSQPIVGEIAVFDLDVTSTTIVSDLDGRAVSQAAAAFQGAEQGPWNGEVNESIFQDITFENGEGCLIIQTFWSATLKSSLWSGADFGVADTWSKVCTEDLVTFSSFESGWNCNVLMADRDYWNVLPTRDPGVLHPTVIESTDYCRFLGGGSVNSGGGITAPYVGLNYSERSHFDVDVTHRVTRVLDISSFTFSVEQFTFNSFGDPL